MLRVFNLGLGMVVIVPPGAVVAAREALASSGLVPVVVGRVEPGVRGVELVGSPDWDGTGG